MAKSDLLDQESANISAMVTNWPSNYSLWGSGIPRKLAKSTSNGMTATSTTSKADHIKQFSSIVMWRRERAGTHRG